MIDPDKAQEYLADETADYSSECCDAPVIGGFCKECMEHAEQAPQENKHQSDCCRAEVKVVGGGEGTNHWECEKCGKSCNDLFYAPQEKSWEKQYMAELEEVLDEYFPKMWEEGPAKIANKRSEALALFIKAVMLTRQVRDEAVREGINRVNLPEYDHSKCPIPQTCIGYQNAESDLENIKSALLQALDTDQENQSKTKE